MDRTELRTKYPTLYIEPMDWNNPRSRLYIEAVLLDMANTNKRLAEELALEKEVNLRVRDVFSSWLGLPT